MTSPIAISAGKSAGPTRCAAIVGYDETTRDDGRAERKQQQTEDGVAELHAQRGTVTSKRASVT